jgi:hypothetical protein
VDRRRAPPVAQKGELRARVGGRRDVRCKLERMRRLARERPLVPALDEVDPLPAQDRDAALYNLGQCGSAARVRVSHDAGKPLPPTPGPSRIESSAAGR